MSATREQLDQALPDLEEKYLKRANLQADNALKGSQNRFEPWWVPAPAPAMAAGGALVGAGGAAALVITQGAGH